MGYLYRGDMMDIEIKIYKSVYSKFYYIEINGKRIGQHDYEIIDLLNISLKMYIDNVGGGLRLFPNGAINYTLERAHDIRGWLESIMILNKLTN